MENVGALFIGTKCPDTSRCELVPAIVFLKELANLPDGIFDAHFPAFDVLGNAIVEWFGDHGDFVFLVRSKGITHHRRGLDDSFAKARNWIGDFELHFRVESTQVVKHAVQV